MTFLTTPYLWLGLAAAAVPVVIHLIRRTKVQVVQFAAMRFLQATSPRMIRRQQLKQILLLVLRILALLLLGLAFARPFLHGSTPMAILAKQQKAIAIVMDASASMLAGTKNQRAKEAAEEIITTAGSARFSIVTAGATPQILLEDGDAAQARSAIRAIQPAPAAGDLREAVLAADNLLRQSRFGGTQRAVHGELHIVSDLQLSNAPEGVVALSSDAEHFASEQILSWQNVAILDGTIDALPACRIKNFSGIEQVIEVTLSASRTTLDLQRVVLQPGEEKIVRFAESRGKLQNADAAYFEIRAGVDDFLHDNQFFCSRESISGNVRKVLAVSSNSAGSFFVRQAFAVFGAASNQTRRRTAGEESTSSRIDHVQRSGAPFRLYEIAPNQIANHPLSDYECIVLSSVAGLERGGVAALKKFVFDGGGLLIAPAAPAGGQEAATFNLMLAELMPAKLQQPVFTAVDRNRSSRLTDVDFTHPIFKLFAEPASGDPASAKFFQYYAVDAKSPAGAGSTLASFDDGHAALLEATAGKGKVLMWTAGFDAQWNDLPLKPIFLPLIHQMADYLARPQIKRESLTVGQPIFLEGFDLSREVNVTVPDGDEQRIAAGTGSFTETSAAGIYRFSQSGRSMSFAVNLDRRESDPQALTAADFLARLYRSEETMQVASALSSADTSELERERSQKLWRFALSGLLMVLFVEGWLAKRTPR